MNQAAQKLILVTEIRPIGFSLLTPPHRSCL